MGIATNLKTLSHAKNHTQTSRNGGLGFPARKLQGISLPPQKPKKETSKTYVIVLLQNRPPLTMPNQGPSDFSIIQLFHAQFTRIRSIGLIEDILGGDSNVGVCHAAGQQ